MPSASAWAEDVAQRVGDRLNPRADGVVAPSEPFRAHGTNKAAAARDEVRRVEDAATSKCLRVGIRQQLVVRGTPHDSAAQGRNRRRVEDGADGAGREDVAFDGHGVGRGNRDRARQRPRHLLGPRRIDVEQKDAGAGCVQERGQRSTHLAGSVKTEPPEATLSTRRHPHLGVLLERARRRLMQAMLDRFRAAGYTDLREAHGPLFAFLPAGGARVTDLAERARITKQSMGELVSELETLGYVHRAADPSDGRAKVVTFTEDGRRAARIGVEAVADEERAWGERIGRERVAELRRALEEITSSGEIDAHDG